MAKVIRFVRLAVENFAGVQSKEVNYGEITRFTGKNGEGKSTLCTAPVWTLYGTDLLGGKFDPAPTTYEYDDISSALTLEVDGTEYVLKRSVVNGTNKFHIDESSKTATEFNSFVSGLFDKDTFLSLYNPAYFFNLHWTKQRDFVMKDVIAPSNKEVFEEMSRVTPEQKAKDISFNPQAARLSEEFKKKSVAGMESDYKEAKGKHDKAHQQAQGVAKDRAKQLKENGTPPEIDRAALEAELGGLQDKIDTFDQDVRKVTDRSREREKLQYRISTLSDRIADGKSEHAELSSKEVKSTCSTCGQDLQDDAKEQAEQTHKDQLKTIAVSVNGLIADKKKLIAELEELPLLPDTEHSVSDLTARVNEITNTLRLVDSHAKATADLATAKQNEVDELKAKNDAIFVLDAIKAFKAQEAQLQVSKVEALFKTLSVRLEEYNKTSDEPKAFFMIQMNGKDYTSLSTGERITAGLELTEFLHNQSGLVTPTFIDSYGEFTDKPLVYGQLITARAVGGKELTVDAT
ncbi:hypothetical protein EJP82_01075 [Paenibacillus anaericanus]|uniref:Nuclease SbcCD subunit C n=1 Tax=Paenibacillus anaericanus TaxID=170367 RepID=A0A3S1BVP0_9BACL|nr:hypothetical protein [Paenibacillus anaericanus]RUT48565.1 hypothetical protein EJP82_01075 [Paenibacillus anaericanus]